MLMEKEFLSDGKIHPDLWRSRTGVQGLCLLDNFFVGFRRSFFLQQILRQGWNIDTEHIEPAWSLDQPPTRPSFGCQSWAPVAVFELYREKYASERAALDEVPKCICRTFKW